MTSSPVPCGISLSLQGAEDSILDCLCAVERVRVRVQNADFRPKGPSVANEVRWVYKWQQPVGNRLGRITLFSSNDVGTLLAPHPKLYSFHVR